jgi:hypothetical protein
MMPWPRRQRPRRQRPRPPAPKRAAALGERRGALPSNGRRPFSASPGEMKAGCCVQLGHAALARASGGCCRRPTSRRRAAPGAPTGSRDPAARAVRQKAASDRMPYFTTRRVAAACVLAWGPGPPCDRRKRRTGPARACFPSERATGQGGGRVPGLIGVGWWWWWLWVVVVVAAGGRGRAGGAPGSIQARGARRAGAAPRPRAAGRKHRVRPRSEGGGAQCLRALIGPPRRAGSGKPAGVAARPRGVGRPLFGLGLGASASRRCGEQGSRATDQAIEQGS